MRAVLAPVGATGGFGPDSDPVAAAAALIAGEAGIDPAVIVAALEDLTEALSNRRVSTRISLLVDPSSRVCESVTSTFRTSPAARHGQTQALRTAAHCVAAGASRVDPGGVFVMLSAISAALRAQSPSTIRVRVDPEAGTCTADDEDVPVALLRRVDACKMLGVSASVIDRLARDGELAVVKLPTGGVRFEVGVLAAFVDRHLIEPRRSIRDEMASTVGEGHPS